MTPPRKPATAEASAPPRFQPHSDDLADVRAGLEEAERGEGVALTPEQLKRWAETGEWPEPSA